jgi:hypothetical protein
LNNSAAKLSQISDEKKKAWKNIIKKEGYI